MTDKISQIPYCFSERYLYRDRVVDKQIQAEAFYRIKNISPDEAPLVARIIPDDFIAEEVEYRLAECHIL